MFVQQKIKKTPREEKKFLKFFHDEQIFWVSLVLITLFFTSSMYLFVWRRFEYTETRLVPLVYSYEKSILSFREKLARQELLIQTEKNIPILSWNRLESFLPSSPQVPRFILELAGLTLQNGFELESLRISNDVTENTPRSSLKSQESLSGIVPISLEIAVKGPNGYQAFIRLMVSLLKSLRFLEITNLSYIPGNDGHTFSLRGFWAQASSQMREDGGKENIADLVKTVENFFKNEKFLQLKSWSQKTEITLGEKIYNEGGTPENPLLLYVSDPGDGESIVISWNGDDMTKKEVHLFRSIDPLSYGTVIATVGANVSYYIDRDVDPNRPYYYRAQIKDASGSFSPSTDSFVGLAHDQTPPPLPEEVRLEILEKGVITLHWKNPQEEDFDSVNIYRSENEESLGMLIGAKIAGESFEDVLPKEGITYYYFFSSLDTRGNESKIVPLKDLVGRSLPFE